MAPDGVRIAHVDDIEGVPGQHYVEGEWKPVRAELGIDAFGANAYVADAGQLIVEEHDELDAADPGASHRELYVVLRGRVLFFGGLPKGTTTIDFPSNVLHYREVAVLGSYASRYRDQVQALDMLEQNTANIRGVVTDVVSLDETPEAFPRIKSGAALKVVVTP